MKLFTFLMIASTLSLFLGCEQQAPPTPNDTSSEDSASREMPKESETDTTSKSDSTSLEDVKKEVSEATEATRKFTMQEMQDYRKNLNAKLDDLDQQLQEWKEKGKDLSGDAKQMWEDQLAMLIKKRDKLQDDIKQLGDSSGDAWKDLKEGIDKAWTELKAAADKASKNFDKS